VPGVVRDSLAVSTPWPHKPHLTAQPALRQDSRLRIQVVSMSMTPANQVAAALTGRTEIGVPFPAACRG